MKRFSSWDSAPVALTSEQMREVDRVMIEELGITLVQMMEHAGRHLAVLAREIMRGVENKRVLVLAGRGNNGGGGLVAARRLATWGASVKVILAAPERDYRDVPAHQLNILKKINVDVQAENLSLGKAELILDALIGYGLRGAPKGLTSDLVLAANASGVPIIALDAPSGVDTSTGKVFEPCIRAQATLTLALPKVGLLRESASAVVGDLYVADIGVPPFVYEHLGIQLPNIFRDADIVRVGKVS